MCLYSYNSKSVSSNDMFPEEYELLKQIYSSISDNNIEGTKNLTQILIDKQLEKGNNSNVSFLQDALNSLK